MQVSIEELGGLERRLTIQIPSSTIDQEVTARLRSLARHAKLDGFRPGKIPFNVVQRMYGAQVRQEVLTGAVESSFRDAVAEANLRPAAGPKIEPKADDDNGSFIYTATFEVVPDFDVQGLESIVVERPVAEVSDADIDRMLETLRKQRTQWLDVARPAILGDKVVIDFEGKLDGESFPGNTGSAVPVVLGAGGMIKPFEDALQGVVAGEQKQADVDFPEDYHSATLSGKTVQFSLSVKSVAEPKLPELDAEFVKSFGIDDGDVESLKQALRENMVRELHKGIGAVVKKQIMDGLIMSNPLELPEVLVSEETVRMARQAGFPESTGSEIEQSAVFEEEARRRVALGLIVSRIVSAEGIKLDEAKLMKQLQMLAETYADPEEVIQWYLQNPQALEGVRALAMEESVVEWLLGKVVVKELPSTFDDVMRPANGGVVRTVA